jgi:hypothetical protein
MVSATPVDGRQAHRARDLGGHRGGVPALDRHPLNRGETINNAGSTWANRRPAVTIEVRAGDGTWIPHGISVLEIQEDRIVGIPDPTLVPRFGLPSAR